MKELYLGPGGLLDPFSYLRDVNPTADRPVDDPNSAGYFSSLIDHTALLLGLSLDAMEKSVLLELLQQLVRDNGNNISPLGQGETMVDLLQGAQAQEADDPQGAGSLYKKAGDISLLASGGVRRIPPDRRMRERDRMAATHRKIQKFLGSNGPQLDHETMDPRRYYQGMARRAYGQAASLGYRLSPPTRMQSTDRLVSDPAELDEWMLSVEDPRRVKAKENLLETIARKVPELSDALFFMKAILLDRDLVLAHQIVQSRSSLARTAGEVLQ